MTLSTEKTQQFSKSLRVFAISHDAAILNSIENMCAQSDYEVARFSKTSLAWDLLKKGNHCVDIIIIDAQMPDPNCCGFVKYVKQQNKSPVIVMSDDQSQIAITKAYQNGADAIWDKPLDENCIKQMWHLVLKKKVENEDEQVRKKRGRDNIKNAPIVTNDNHDHQPKNIFVWTNELHEGFVNVVKQLGLDKAKPKEIMNKMNVPGMKATHVSSHLQKYKLKTSNEGTPLNNKMPRGRRKKSKLNEGREVHHHSMSSKNSNNNNDNQAANTARVSDDSIGWINLSPIALPQLSLEVAHPIPEQNHNVTLDSVNELFMTSCWSDMSWLSPFLKDKQI